ncbi:hypothetical protein Q8G50_33230, partial [Klebsiella pneumoniae]
LLTLAWHTEEEERQYLRACQNHRHIKSMAKTIHTLFANWQAALAAHLFLCLLATSLSYQCFA